MVRTLHSKQPHPRASRTIHGSRLPHGDARHVRCGSFSCAGRSRAVGFCVARWLRTRLHTRHRALYACVRVRHRCRTPVLCDPTRVLVIRALALGCTAVTTTTSSGSKNRVRAGFGSRCFRPPRRIRRPLTGNHALRSTRRATRKPGICTRRTDARPGIANARIPGSPQPWRAYTRKP